MWKWRKADWIWFVAMWVLLTFMMLMINHYGKLAAEPKIFWIVCFPPFISWLMVLRDRTRARK